MTIAEAVSDLRRRLGGNSDDFDISDPNLKVYLDNARTRYIDDYMEENGNQIWPGMTVRFTCKGLTETERSCSNCPDWTLVLPVPVMDFPYDAGLTIFLPGGEVFERRHTSGMNDLLIKQGFTAQKGWYRIGTNVFIVGQFPYDITFAMDLVPSSILGLIDTLDFPVPSGTYANVMALAAKIGQETLGAPYDLTNDGKFSRND